MWEIETVGKQRAYFARGPMKKKRVTAGLTLKSVRADNVVKETIMVVEVDLEELDDDIESTKQPDTNPERC